MLTSVKKFSEEISRLNLTLLSILAALISVNLTQFQPYLQFILTLSLVFMLLTPFFLVNGALKELNKIFPILALCLILLISIDSLISLLTVFFIISIFRVPYISDKSEKYFGAFQAHLADTIATLAALSSLEEANPLLKILIDNIGRFPALIGFKLGLIGVILYLVNRNFDGENELFILKTITVLGLSMASRNIFLLI